MHQDVVVYVDLLLAGWHLLLEIYSMVFSVVWAIARDGWARRWVVLKAWLHLPIGPSCAAL